MNGSGSNSISFGSNGARNLSHESGIRTTVVTLGSLATCADEFLVHAADVEGLCRGIDHDLVTLLANSSPLPVTYAGGARSLTDLEEVSRRGQGRVDLTIGSALDIFGGTGVRYADVVEFNRREQQARSAKGAKPR